MISSISAQNAIDQIFPSVYHINAFDPGYTDQERTLHIGDSLYEYSTSGHESIHSLMFLAQVSEKEGRYLEAIKKAENSLKVAKALKDNHWQVAIYLFLSSQMRLVGMSQESIVMFKKAEEIVARLPISNKTLLSKAGVFLEKGRVSLYNSNQSSALKNFKLARSLIIGYQENIKFKNAFLSKNEKFLGDTYLSLKQFDQSLWHYDRSVDYLQKTKLLDKEKEIGLFQGYAKIYLGNDNMECSEFYFQKAVENTKKIDNKFVQGIIFGDLLNFYRLQKDEDSVAYYSALYIDVLDYNNKRFKKIIVSEITELRKENWWTTASRSLIFAGLILGIILIIYFLLRLGKYIKASKSDLLVSETEKEIKPSLVISLVTETEIILSLEKFEKSKLFLRQEMTLSFLATHLSTNEKYLRHIIQKHKNNDFNNYINHLRINYIVFKLHNDSAYRQYKISYLAEESGFSSHSKFSSYFKRFLKQSPSDYIQNMSSIEFSN